MAGLVILRLNNARYLFRLNFYIHLNLAVQSQFNLQLRVFGL